MDAQLKNVATGLFLIFAEPFRTGSICRVLNLVGFIERVSLARTIMRRRDGGRVFIPNGIFADTHQTSGNARELRHHTVLLRVRSSTSADTLQLLINDLRLSLAKFAVAPENLFGERLPPLREVSAASESGITPPYAGTPQASSVFTNNTHGLGSFRSSTDSRNWRAIRDDEINQTVSVELHAMYAIKASVQIDRGQFRTLEAAKTEVSSFTIIYIRVLCVSRISFKLDQPADHRDTSAAQRWDASLLECLVFSIHLYTKTQIKAM